MAKYTTIVKTLHVGVYIFTSIHTGRWVGTVGWSHTVMHTERHVSLQHALTATL